MMSIRTILHPTDFSECSTCAFRMASSLARQYDAQLVVLYVVPLPAMMYGPPPESYLDHLLEKLRAIKPGDPKTRVQYQLVEGDPAAAILKVAREINCDMIVVGTHGRGRLGRLLMGSVAEQVARNATCAVLVVKPTQRTLSSCKGPVAAMVGPGAEATK
jgi:nucleotide-binding universal stress UspA family protein